jgi:glyoxylase-like metal-dependent hydrolase (beta-lactamase superfamily II)/rhodanese-related sulfurtransferase
MKMIFQQINPHSCKTYIIYENGPKKAIFVDPVLDHFNDYLDLLKERNLQLHTVIDTHTHADHISGASALSDITGCDYLMHEKAPVQCVTIKVSEGYEFMTGNILFSVIETPGHTMDSISLIFPKKILTGDALFLDDGGAGRDDLPGGDPGLHWESLNKFKKLPEELVVYPAHDYREREPSTLAIQKFSNPHLKDRTKEEFIRYIEDLRLGPADWMKDVLSANYACARDPEAVWVPVDGAACEIKGTLEHGVNDIVVGEVSAKELRSIIETEVDLVLLDVREKKELTQKYGHLENILHIPMGDLTKRLSELSDMKNKHIITICRSGKRATTAAQIMTQAGFSNVEVLAGGMKAWRKTYGFS